MPDVSSNGRPNTSKPSVDPLRSLLAATLAGGLREREMLVGKLAPPLLRIVRGALGRHHPDALDVLQESIMRVLTALPNFRGEGTVVHFAARVTLHVIGDFRRRDRGRFAVEIDAALDELADQERPQDQLASARELVRIVFDELPLVQAEALVLRSVLGYSVDEVAEAAGIPVNTARSRLRSAKATLRARLAGGAGEVGEVPDDD